MDGDANTVANDIGPSRSCHWWAALVVGATGTITSLFCPDLVTTPIDRLTFLGTFVTFYGVIFAVIEVMRLQSAAKLAAREARKVYNQLTRLRANQMAERCQAYIHSALRSTENKKHIPESLVTDITTTYREIFDEATWGSEDELLMDYIEAYLLSDRKGPNNHSGKTVSALNKMSRNCAAVKNRNTQTVGDAS